ncbi:LCP family protein [Actinospica robiniae]|uniref:LCP family protein n=1 Tax=Actinospica robiniae TaxID=304901 RepID=UPI0006858665|nr:LCP family protein [Actinospica robiniae]
MHGRDDTYVNRDPDLDEIDPPLRSRSSAGQNPRRAAQSNRPNRRRGRSSRSGKRRALRYVGFSLAGLLVATAGVGGYVYVHLNGNIKSSSLLPNDVTQAPEIPDQFGRTAMNILLLGNSARLDAADCHLGGACDDTESTADTLMVMHVAADRSNMTIMSIPRDSIVDLPSCAHATRGLMNAALSGGPSCAVQAVNDLTGLTIDHFIEIDMSGVVTMSNALGGVPVCVTNNIYDSYSHLKLPKGTSVIQGQQALAWLRTRHAFPDERYREQAQHMFLAALFRKLSANESLTHVSTLYSVADAATKSLTVDPKLSSITSLLSLAQELGKVPANRITMLSVPTDDYSGTNAAWKEQLQFSQPAADQMFAAIKSDTSYTSGSKAGSGDGTGSGSGSGSGKAGASATASSAGGASTSGPNAANVVTSTVHAVVENGSGQNGRAGAIAQVLVSAGFTSANIIPQTAAVRATTALYYPSNRADSAAAVAQALGIPSSSMHESADYTQVTVVIGQDWKTGDMFSTATSSGGAGGSSTAVASSAPLSSHETNAGDSNACMAVQKPEW